MKTYYKFISEGSKTSKEGAIIAKASDFPELEAYFQETLLKMGITSEIITQMCYVMSKKVNDTKHVSLPYFLNLYNNTFDEKFFNEHLKDKYSIKGWKNMLKVSIKNFKDIYMECDALNKMDIYIDIITRHFTKYEDLGTDVYSQDFETWNSVSDGYRLAFTINHYNVTGNKFDALREVINHMNLLKSKMKIDILDMSIETRDTIYIRFIISTK